MIIVVLKKDADLDAFETLLLSKGYSVERRLVRHLYVDREGLTADTFEFSQHPSVELVGDNKPRPIDYAATDVAVSADGTLFNGWALARICRRATPWSKSRLDFPINTFTRHTRTGVGVDYYMIDSGCDMPHPEFAGRVTNIGNVTDPDLDDGSIMSGGHGTSSMSCVAGATCGMARGCSPFYFGVQHELDYIAPADQDYVDACNTILTHYNSRAGLNRPAVCSMSIAGVGPNIPVITAAFNTLIDAGIAVVFPAGNEKKDLSMINVTPTEDVDDAIIVGATGILDRPMTKRHLGTNYGVDIDISAPGQAIRGAKAASQGPEVYRVIDGTSFACPYTAGVLVCMLEGYQRMTTRTQVQNLKAHLIANATTGQIVNDYGITLPDRLLYLNPNVTFETIAGLVPL